jgi:SAM-dependent methyltransferase
VLDLGCGTGVFYSRWLRGKAVEYMGLDINATFVDRLTRLGVNARVWDLRRPDPLPAADAVVMQSSLYHFLPDVAPILARMIASARRQVIVSEPIRNLAGSPVPILGTIARRLKRSAAGAATGHFTEETLDAVFAPYSTSHARSFLIPGGRDKVYVLATG